MFYLSKLFSCLFKLFVQTDRINASKGTIRIHFEMHLIIFGKCNQSKVRWKILEEGLESTEISPGPVHSFFSLIDQSCFLESGFDFLVEIAELHEAIHHFFKTLNFKTGKHLFITLSGYLKHLCSISVQFFSETFPVSIFNVLFDDFQFLFKSQRKHVNVIQHFKISVFHGLNRLQQWQFFRQLF